MGVSSKVMNLTAPGAGKHTKRRAAPHRSAISLQLNFAPARLEESTRSDEVEDKEG